MAKIPKAPAAVRRVGSRKLVIGSVIFVTGALVGIGLSLLFVPRYATGQEVEQARQEIAAKFINESSLACTDTSDPISPSGRFVVFYKYLRVNRYANRAVIRGCNNADSLLVKKKDGTWVKTDVNMNLDARANPRWQSACDIADITIADDQDRPENKSLDEQNFQACMKLREL